MNGRKRKVHRNHLTRHLLSILALKSTTRFVETLRPNLPHRRKFDRTVTPSIAFEKNWRSNGRKDRATSP